MEERVGQLWHRAITRAASTRHDDAAVTLDEMRRSLRMLLHAGRVDAHAAAGGAGAGLRLVEAHAHAHGGRRTWLERLAGTGRREALASVDDDAVRLPARIAVFDDHALNRALYLWLAARAAVHAPREGEPWIDANVRETATTLEVFPGLAPSHARLLAASLALRAGARDDEAEREVRRALTGAATRSSIDVVPAMVAPVWVWLYPAARTAGAAPRRAAHRRREASSPAAADDRKRRHAERVDDHRDHAPLVLPFRAESLLSVAERVKVNRADDDREEADAASVADDMHTLSIADGSVRTASRVRFDLDLPSEADDDLPLGPGTRLPEWNWKRGALIADHCAVQVRVARHPGSPHLPPTLAASARRLRTRLTGLRAAPRTVRGLREGDTLDLDAWVRFAGQRRASPRHEDDPPVHQRSLRGERSLATLLLADLSMSTESPIGRPRADGRPGARDAHHARRARDTRRASDDDRRVIDVIADALHVWGEALDGSGDAFEMLGFHSVRRHHVRIQHLKGFDEPWGDAARARVAALKPGFYTRMGAAVREGTRRLAQRPEKLRLLLLLTDGKPTDLDAYDGRWGLEDTRHAVLEARRAGLIPFAITIDRQAHEVLPTLFGQQGFAWVHRGRDLPERLVRIYGELTRVCRRS